MCLYWAKLSSTYQRKIGLAMYLAINGESTPMAMLATTGRPTSHPIFASPPPSAAPMLWITLYAN